MFKGLTAAVIILFAASAASAQSPSGIKDWVYKYSISGGKQDSSIRPLEGDQAKFIDPKDSLITLQRQVEIQFLSKDFLPSIEKETDPIRRKNLRYAVGYYRDCQVAGIAGFVDVVLPLRFDSRSGSLEIKYFNQSIIVNPAVAQFPEDRSAFAVLPLEQGAAMLLLNISGGQQIITFEGLFTSDPHPVDVLTLDDVDGLKADESANKFAVFVRGGAARASLFILNSGTSLQDLDSIESFRDLAATDRAYIFTILPAVVPYRVAPIRPLK